MHSGSLITKYISSTCSTLEREREGGNGGRERNRKGGEKEICRQRKRAEGAVKKRPTERVKSERKRVGKTEICKERGKERERAKEKK